jgi:serine/threonine protein kinase
MKALTDRKSLTESQWSLVSELVNRLEPLPELRRQAELRGMFDQGEAPSVLSLVALRLQLPPEEDRRRIGDKIGNYTLLEQIGVGGMGVAYLARHDNTERLAVVKLIHPSLAATDKKATERFLDEIKILGLVSQHGGIVQVIDGGIHTDPSDLGGTSFPFLAMEFVRGDPITKYQREREMDVPETVDLFLRVCDAIIHAHELRVIHRDLKPQHILIDKNGFSHILDFGLSRLFDPSLPLAARELFAGTPDYMSPEQVDDSIDLGVGFWSDVYALGMILFELVSGRRPYEVPLWPREAIRRAIIETKPAKLGSLNGYNSGELERIIFKAIQKNPVDRYRSVALLKDDLRRYLDSQERQRGLRKGHETENRFEITLKENIIIRVLFGRIEEVPTETEDTIVALPANEFFDDESFHVKSTSVGSYFTRHFTRGQIEELKSIINSELLLIKSCDEIIKKPGKLAKSYTIGTCVFLNRPFDEDKRILLVACSTERMPHGNRAEAEFLFNATHAIHEYVKEKKLYRRIILPLFCSGNARMNRVRALHLLLLGFCETIYKSNPAHFEEINIVVFKKTDDSQPEVDPTRVEEQLLFIKKLYNS